MLQSLPYVVKPELLYEAEKLLPNVDFKSTINQPTGRFFYDPWEIKTEYKGTVWEEILNTLPYSIGEARLIRLQPQQCYTSHADIDDRWHLNITGKKSYLIDLDSTEMYETKRDFFWHLMNAGKLHSAVNFGNRDRCQLVVRKLLFDMDASDYKTVEITTNIDSLDTARYEFDNLFSPILNKLNKLRAISDFEYTREKVTFKISPFHMNDLKVESKLFDVNLV